MENVKCRHNLKRPSILVPCNMQQCHSLNLIFKNSFLKIVQSYLKFLSPNRSTVRPKKLWTRKTIKHLL